MRGFWIAFLRGYPWASQTVGAILVFALTLWFEHMGWYA